MNRAGFKEYCLRDLGKPVIDINVDDFQVEDRIDEALRYYFDYHFDGSQKIYYKHQVTDQDKTNGYITLPENIMGVVKIFDLSSAYNTSSLFDVRYQFAMNDMWLLTSASMAPYVMAMEHLQFMESILIGKVPIRYNRHVNKLYLDMDWNKINTGSYLIVEAYEIVDPAVFADVWDDRWLKEYCTALIKRQWGNNLKKFEGMEMPGGVKFNGQRIYDEAINEIEKLRHEMINSYSLPASDMIG
jgi:hypothetical protein